MARETINSASFSVTAIFMIRSLEQEFFALCQVTKLSPQKLLGAHFAPGAQAIYPNVHLPTTKFMKILCVWILNNKLPGGSVVEDL